MSAVCAVQFHAGDLVQYVKAVLHQQNPDLPMTMVCLVPKTAQHSSTGV